MNETVVTKDATIEQLNNNITRKDMVIEALEREKEEHKAQFSRTNQTLQEQARKLAQLIAKLNDTKKENEAQISRINGTVQEQVGKLAKQDKLIDKFNHTKKDDKAQILRLNQTVQQKTGELAQQDKLIAELLAQQDKLIAELNDTIKKFSANSQINPNTTNDIESQFKAGFEQPAFYLFGGGTLLIGIVIGYFINNCCTKEQPKKIDVEDTQNIRKSKPIERTGKHIEVEQDTNAIEQKEKFADLNNSEKTSSVENEYVNKAFYINEATQNANVVEVNENPYYGGLDDFPLETNTSN